MSETSNDPLDWDGAPTFSERVRDAEAEAEMRLEDSGGYAFPDVHTTLKWEETDLYHDWYRKIVVGYPNSFTVAITPSSKTGVSGTGKTTLGTVLGKEMDVSKGGFVAEDKGTCLIKDVPKMLREAGNDPGGAYVIDETQGTPDSPGFDSRRGMSEVSRKAIAAILANRNKRMTVILISQQLGMLDARLFPMLDAWLLITKEPDAPDGPLCVHHKLTTNDYEIKNPKIRTPAIEDLTWPELPAEDSDYMAMERKKEESQSGYSNSDGEKSKDQPLPDRHQIAIAQEYRNLGKSLKWIEDNVESISYSREWVRLNTEKPSEDSDDSEE